MSDLPDDLPDDELVSAVLDGEADAGAHERVHADEALAARLTAFATVRDAVVHVEVDDDLVSRVRAGALAAWDAERAAAAPATAPVTSLATARRRRAGAPRWLAAGAAAAAVVVAIGALAGLRTTNQEDAGDAARFEAATANTADAAGDSAQAAPPGALERDRATPASPSGGGVTATAPADLGAVGDLAALRLAYRDLARATPERSTIAPPAGAEASGATTAFATCSVGAVARAQLAGRSVVLVVVADTVQVLDGASCSVVGTFPV